MEEWVVRVVFVHGACVRDGAWWWEPTAASLRERGIASVTPGLPSCGETGVPAGAGGPGLPEDVAEIRAVLQDGDEPTVVVAHSYGGTVITEAAAGVDAVRHLVFVSSYLAEVGQSQSEFGDGSVPPFLDVDPAAGTFGVRPEALVDTFLQDCPPQIQDEAVRHLARQNVEVLGQPVGAAAWHDVATTYVVCARDRGTPPAAQREFARRADRVVELDTGHHPFLSRPAAMSELVLGL